MAYSASDIDVLEGLEPVRKRPAMYIGGTDVRGYHHLLWEIVDNSIDEAINGHADKIEVTLDKDFKGATVRDNGRGIPIDKHPKHKKTALELILCTLHAGGKFEGKNYQVSGGLHGVGSSVVNALSESLTARVTREGAEHEQQFARGAVASKLKKVGAARGSGTSIHFRPDAQIFGKTAAFDPKRVREALEAKSYLHKGLKIVFKQEKGSTREEFHHPRGVVEFLEKTVAEAKQRAVHESPFALEREEPIRMELALQWTEGTEDRVRTYANGIPTASGGTHEGGFKQGVTKAVRAYMAQHKLAPKGLTITADDIREGLSAIVSVYVQEPQFQGQTKDRLNNPEVTALVENTVRTALEQWFYDNKSVAEGIVARIVMASRARAASRAAVQQVRRKSPTRRLNLPGKLADCASSDPDECELFLVEGDSAGGNAKQGRDRRTQAILPLRGKVLNAERANRGQVASNRELQDIVSALGCGIGKTYDGSKLRYGKIFLLMDADSDGHHIATLLLTFFYRMMPSLIRDGHIYLAQPPLFRIDHQNDTYWALDEAHRKKILAKLPKNAKTEISRFKGLGEMTADELRSTTLDRSTRQVLRVVIDGELETDKVFSDLMGKDPAARFDFIMDQAKTADAEELDL